MMVLVDTALAALVEQAQAAGLHFDTALALVVELELLKVEMICGRPGSATTLDGRARAARTHAPLDRAASAYLTMLSARNDHAREAQAPSAGEMPCLLPGRLWTRLATGGAPPLRLRGCDLGRAIAWERSAILQGLTMTEWAAWELLASQTT